MKSRLPILLLLAAAAGTPRAAAQLLPPGATATLRTSVSGAFTEGPLYDAANNRVLFTDLTSSHLDILSYNLATLARTTADPNSGGANGMYYDADGHIVSADRNRHQISRRSLADLTVVETVLASGWNAPAFTPFIGPNDLVIDSGGGIYFTDPNYGDFGPTTLQEAVYYRSPAGAVTRLLTGFSHPNGIILSPDQQTLYVAMEGEKRIMAYDVTTPGVLANQREFAKTNVAPIGGNSNGPDGLTIDAAGNVYAAVQSAVFAWNPAGQRILSLAVGMDPTNVEFGGRNRKTLFITAGNALYGIGLNAPAALPGDFDYDGDVDADDLVVFQTEYGTALTGDALNADANADGVADGADLLAWQQRLTTGAPATTSAAAAGRQNVPEPSGMASLALVAGLLRRRRKAFAATS